MTSRTELAARVLLAELIDASAGIDDLLLACIERMACGTHFDLKIMTERGTRLEHVAAAAGDGDFFVLGMNASFHDSSGTAVPLQKGAQCSLAFPVPQPLSRRAVPTCGYPQKLLITRWWPFSWNNEELYIVL